MDTESTSYYVILGILSLGPGSGYDVKKKIEQEIGYIYKVSNGQIYPVLKKLIKQNAATYITEKNDGRPDRKVYTVTEKGTEIFKRWLHLPIDLQIKNEDELLLRLYFGSLEPIGRNIALVDGFRHIKEKNLQSYDRIAGYFNLDTIRTLPDHYSYFTLRFGQIVAQAYVDWSDEVISVLRKLDEKSR